MQIYKFFIDNDIYVLIHKQDIIGDEFYMKSINEFIDRITRVNSKISEVVTNDCEILKKDENIKIMSIPNIYNKYGNCLEVKYITNLDSFLDYLHRNNYVCISNYHGICFNIDMISINNSIIEFNKFISNYRDYHIYRNNKTTKCIIYKDRIEDSNWSVVTTNCPPAIYFLKNQMEFETNGLSDSILKTLFNSDMSVTIQIYQNYLKIKNEILINYM